MDKLLFGPDVPFPESRGLPTFFSPSMAGKYSQKCKSASKLVRMLSTLSCFLLLKPVTKACLTIVICVICVICVSFVCHLLKFSGTSWQLGPWPTRRIESQNVAIGLKLWLPDILQHLKTTTGSTRSLPHWRRSWRFMKVFLHTARSAGLFFPMAYDFGAQAAWQQRTCCLPLEGLNVFHLCCQRREIKDFAMSFFSTRGQTQANKHGFLKCMFLGFLQSFWTRKSWKG
jgi:hypothetical protein